MADKYFCGSCNASRLKTKCEKCGKPTVTVGTPYDPSTGKTREETPQELLKRWKSLYGGG